MPDKKPFYIKIVGAKIKMNANRSKVPELDVIVIDDQSFDDYNSAYAYADKTCRKLKQDKCWQASDITVVEHVPVKRAVYGLHLQQLKLTVNPFFIENWASIMSNPVVTSVQHKLTDNNHALLVDIVCSFLRGHCQDFVNYEREVRQSDLKSYRLALHDYIVGYYKEPVSAALQAQDASDPAEMGN